MVFEAEGGSDEEPDGGEEGDVDGGGKGEVDGGGKGEVDGGGEGLNSFFQSHADKQETLTKLESYLADNNHGLSLLVTHQVVIRAITGHSVESGGLVAYNSTTGQAVPVRVDYIGK